MNIFPKKYRDLAMSGRIVLILITTITASLVVAALGLTAYDARTYQHQKLRDLNLQGQMLAASATAALAFDDRKEAQGYLDLLESGTHIETAAIYDGEGHLFASVPETGGQVPLQAPVLGDSIDKDRMMVSLPAIQAGRRFGSVTITSVPEPIGVRISRYTGLIILLLLSSLVLGILITGQVALRDANHSLQKEIAEREKAEAALRQAQKMEAIGQITGGVAHDFNNTLAVILSGLDLIERKLARGDGDVGKLISMARDGARRGATLTQRLLAFSRRQTLQPEVLDVNLLVIGMADILHSTLGETVTIETALGADAWNVHADRHQLESALLNLAVNGRDAMGNDGKLTIRTTNLSVASRDGEAGALQLPEGHYLLLSVTDTGSGMTQDVLEKAFDPFFTTKPPGKGTGLGLSQVLGFVQQSGGRVKLKSEPGAGTTVELYFPRHISTDFQPLPKPVVAAPTAESGETILLVEDEDQVREVVVCMVRELGYEVIEAASGARALDLLNKHANIALLFTDVVMPEMNGHQLALEARRLKPGLPVLFTSGYSHDAVVHKGLLDGTLLLTKPASIEELATALRESLRSSSKLSSKVSNRIG